MRRMRLGRQEGHVQLEPERAQSAGPPEKEARPCDQAYGAARFQTLEQKKHPTSPYLFARSKAKRSFRISRRLNGVQEQTQPKPRKRARTRAGGLTAAWVPKVRSCKPATFGGRLEDSADRNEPWSSATQEVGVRLRRPAGLEVAVSGRHVEDLSRVRLVIVAFITAR
jgi:hypothetical protein